MVQNDLFAEFAPCRFGRVSDSRNNGGKAFLRDPKLLRPIADFTPLGHADTRPILRPPIGNVIGHGHLRCPCCDNALA
jgi:hypothetical protein